MVPADDHAMVLPWASVIVIMVLLNEALTCATPEEMFLRSRRRGLARPVCCCCSLAIQLQLQDEVDGSGAGSAPGCLGFGVRQRLRQSSSCRRSAAPCPCGCVRWCGCADPAPAARGDDAGRDSSPG